MILSLVGLATVGWVGAPARSTPEGAGESAETKVPFSVLGLSEQLRKEGAQAADRMAIFHLLRQRPTIRC